MSFTYDCQPSYVLRLRARSTPEKPLYLGEKPGSIVRDIFEARRHLTLGYLQEALENQGIMADLAIDTVFIQEATGIENTSV